MNARPIAAALLAAAAFVPGCISPQNDRLTLGQNVTLEAFQPSPPAAAQTPQTTAAALPLAQPSLTGIDRNNWSKVQVLVPVDGTAHNPTYARRVLLTDKTARQRDLYPTALTALEVTGGSESEQQLELPANVLASTLECVLMPISLIWQAPWTTRWSPDAAYARYSHPERPEAQGIQTPTQPFTIPPPTPVTP